MKLNINRPGDKYEQEANLVAELVMPAQVLIGGFEKIAQTKEEVLQTFLTQ